MFAISTAAVFTFVFVSTVRAEIKTVFSIEKTYNGSVKVFAYTRDRYFSYIACERSPPILFPTNCIIFHQVMDGKSQQLSCSIELQAYAGNLFYNVHPFTSDKTIVTWGNQSTSRESSVKYTIVDLLDCEITEVDLKVDALPDFKGGNLLSFGLVVNNDETFSVLINRAKFCQNKACRMTFDARGSRIDGPVPWYTPLHGAFVSVLPADVEKSYTVVEYSRTNHIYRISLVNDAGHQILKEVKSLKRGLDYDISTAHKARRICNVDDSNSTVHCQVFDANAEATSNVTLNLGYQVDGVMVQNQADGRFLLLDQTNSRKFVHVTKVRADGKIIGSIQMPELDCKNKKWSTNYVVFDKPSNPYYLSSLCHTVYQNFGILKVARYQFTDEDFN